jgi:hypothetical protein
MTIFGQSFTSSNRFPIILKFLSSLQAFLNISNQFQTMYF